ncbi:hypothetical protein V6N13_011792 [Hibiscus sabdariffa]|uniref:Uncharacterized protein n=1 Tax=Hibiscus sabdariffa TaxID=183260 RepID=A0ABR2SE55_9ROSI
MLETLLPGCFVWKYQNETTTFANVGLRPVQEINYVRHVCVEQIFLRPLVHASFPELRDFGGFDGLLKRTECDCELQDSLEVLIETGKLGFRNYRPFHFSRFLGLADLRALLPTGTVLAASSDSLSVNHRSQTRVS